MEIRVKSVVLLFLIACFPIAAYPRPVVNAKHGIERQRALHDLLPIGLKAYSSSDVLKIDLSRKVKGSMALQVATLPNGHRALFADATTAPRKGGYLPVILSLIVPGSGEIYMGYYKRGAALVAMDAVGWIGFAVYRSKGLDTRKEYEKYADDHWSVDNWLNYHPAGPYYTIGDLEADGSSGNWKNYLNGNVTDDFFYMPFISRDEDKQHYYENLGKYNWFISGWDDWDSSVQTSGYYSEYSEHRAIYRSMRVKSNDQLTNADRFVYLSIVARAYSLIETIILSKKSSEESAAGGEPAHSAHFHIEPKGFYSTVFSLEYRFK
jgi:hypothetical protein